MKTGHLEIRPWYVRKEETTRAHALRTMLALKVWRHLEKGWEKLEVTVEEGLAELGTLCVVELMDALGLTMPSIPPEAKVVVGTRKKIQDERKAAVK